MRAKLRLSVLDQTPVVRGETAADAVAKTLSLARLADQAGYHRFWVAEHHATPSVAGVAPEALIGPIAVLTERIRVGSGGVMLPHYSPFKVAETFLLLSALAPKRVDLGLGRAPGGSEEISRALQGSRAGFGPDFPKLLGELETYLSASRRPPPSSTATELALQALADEPPELWLLGSSVSSALLAGRLGISYCYADFISPHGEQIVDTYRKEFRPSLWNRTPNALVAVWAFAGRDRDEAERLVAPLRMMYSKSSSTTFVPTTAEVETWRANTTETVSYPKRAVLGSPSQVVSALHDVAEAYTVDELMLVNIMSDHADRCRCYELIASGMGSG